MEVDPNKPNLVESLDLKSFSESEGDDDEMVPVPLAMVNLDASLMEQEYWKKITMELDRLVNSFENILEGASVYSKDSLQTYSDAYMIKVQAATFSAGVERLLLLTSNLKAAVLVNDFDGINKQVSPLMHDLTREIQELQDKIAGQVSNRGLKDPELLELAQLCKNLSCSSLQ